MSIKQMIKEKREWRALKTRVNALPREYQIVYKEILRYLLKVGPVDIGKETGPLCGIIELFEEGATAGKDVFEVTGADVAAFCDELIKDTKTYVDNYQDAVNQKTAESIKKHMNKR